MTTTPQNTSEPTRRPAIRLCVDCREFTGRGETGIGRYLRNLLSQLAQRPEIKLTCCLGATGKAPAELAGRAAVKTMPPWPTPVLDQIVLPRIAAGSAADWFFSPYYKTPLFGPFRKIITVHDIMFLRLPGKQRLRQAAEAVQLAVAARRADVILVDSDFTASDLADYLPRAAPKIRRLYPDLAAEWFEQRQAELPAAPPYFLYVGNFKPHKNAHLLVRAFAEFRKTAPELPHKLVLAGTDPVNAANIASLIGGLAHAADIVLETEVSDERLRELYRRAEWFITASEYEGFGYPALEAFASNCPVICHPNTALKELAGDAALHIPELTVAAVAATLQKAAAMPESERRAFIERGRNRAEIFRPGAAADRFLAILDEMRQTHENTG